MAIRLSSEQKEVVQLVLDGKNVLVDACIGSGKTTTIQKLCSKIKNKKILYLTYNKCLKTEARSKIKQKNVEVNNYHGFAWKCLNDIGVHVSVNQIIPTFIKRSVNVSGYDLLLVDEYQDINEEISQLLEKIKRANPNIQIVMVGDMKQKIYDWTTLDVENFVKGFLGDYEERSFTQCFRLSAEWADTLGGIWDKEIKGVNKDCNVEIIRMNEEVADIDKVVEILSQYEPSQILCLGNRNGTMTETLNRLEWEYPQKFNKKTVFATIKEKGEGSTNPDKECAIFTTFDGSKGLEREICVVFDWDMSNWARRSQVSDVNPEILRNIFCVGASRGKKKVYLVERYLPISVEQLGECIKASCRNNKVKHNYNKPFRPSEMFDFKYKEDVDKCFDLLDITTVKRNVDGNEIKVRNSDGLIDISIVWGAYQEVLFFNAYDKAKAVNYQNYITNARGNEKVVLSEDMKENNSEASWKYSQRMAQASTKQTRYITQVRVKPKDTEEKAIEERLAQYFDNDDEVQKIYKVSFEVKDRDGKLRSLLVVGLADVVKNDMIHELKFVSEVSPTHFLQLAMYLIMSDTEKGILYNTKNDELFEVRIKDRGAFVNAVVKAITKGYYSEAVSYTCGEMNIPV